MSESVKPEHVVCWTAVSGRVCRNRPVYRVWLGTNHMEYCGLHKNEVARANPTWKWVPL